MEMFDARELSVVIATRSSRLSLVGFGQSAAPVLRTFFFIIVFWRVLHDSGCAAEETFSPASEILHAFYYPWYGEPKTDGAYSNWNHIVAVRSGPHRRFPGGDDIGANFFPELGCYSVNNAAVLDEHMRQLRRARIGVICVSWWGKESFTDRALPGLFRAAEAHGIKINFHLEPSLGPNGRNAQVVRDSIVYLIDKFGESPSLYRDAKRGGRPAFYVYDSYLTPAKEWATIFAPESPTTLRGGPHDAVVIGLWVKEEDSPFFLDGHFDGCYTYFATNGFTFGSTWRNWTAIAEWARDHGKLFVPCVAPGYVDTRIRPWNGANTRGRENGAYFDRSFKAAIDIHPEIIGVTSFNEWHEGTQIEPAVPKTFNDYRYEDYEDRAPTWYLDRTAYWADQLDPAP